MNRIFLTMIFLFCSVFSGVSAEPGVPAAPSLMNTLMSAENAEPATRDVSERVVLEAKTTDNGVQEDLALEAQAASDRYRMKLSVSQLLAENYVDGNDDEVISAYEKSAFGLQGSMLIDDTQRLSARLKNELTEDALYAGEGMDALELDKQQAEIAYQWHSSSLGQAFETMKLRLFQHQQTRLQDNYSLRDAEDDFARITADTDKSGLALELQGKRGLWQWKAALSLEDVTQDAQQYEGSTADDVERLHAYLWPDVRFSNQKLQFEAEREFANADSMLVALALAQHGYSAQKADRDPLGPASSPNALYVQYYGAAAEAATESHVNAEWFYLLPVGQRSTLILGLTREAVSASASERYMALDDPIPEERWVGNPFLKPEIHQQLNLGWDYLLARFESQLTLYYDQVQDYIVRDHYLNGQGGVDGATIYRNVDAQLYGLTWAMQWQATPEWRFDFDATSTVATNTADDRAISQTPPLKGNLSAAYVKAAWEAGAKWRWSAKQTRVDDDPVEGSGEDSGETPGYSVVDLSAAYIFSRAFSLRLGVENAFNDVYSEHVNRDNRDPFSQQPLQVNEAGRTLWLKVSGQF